jgi:Transglutaminase elicitor
MVNDTNVRFENAPKLSCRIKHAKYVLMKGTWMEEMDIGDHRPFHARRQLLSLHRLPLALLIRLSVLLVLMVSTAVLTPHTAAANQEIGQSVAAPWSGWWWPLLDSRNPNLYDPEQALQAYDNYVVQTRGMNPGTQQWEYDHQRTTDRDATWWGYCHAWAAAAVLEQEPRTLTKAGRIFTLNQVKGMLIVTYDNLIVTQWGRRYARGAPQSYYDDIHPRVFDELLRHYVGQLRQALILDLEPGPEVWNFPVFAYERTATEMGASTEITMTIHYARPIEGIMGAQWETKTYSYTLAPDTDGQWTGPSVDDHPDFVWLPVRRAPHPNPIAYEIVREILDTADNYAPSPATLTPSDVTSESGVPQFFVATYTDANDSRTCTRCDCSSRLPPEPRIRLYLVIPASLYFRSV